MTARHLTTAAWALGALGLLAACSDNAAGKARVQLPPVPVSLGDVVEKIIPVQLTAVGNAQAYTTVGIKSQINGQLVEVRFKAGQDVQKGDLLFVIDPRPFEAALRQTEAALNQRQAEVRQAQATVERDTAQLANARVQERRYRELVAKELIAREQYDQLNTNMAAMEATVEADKAAVENARAALQAAQANVDNARLQLGYTTIGAPIDGRTGNLLVQNGNILKANDDNPIVVINQIHPIYVSFAVPEQHLTDIKKYRAAGTLKVVARPPRQQETLATGELTFVNNSVDQTTATIQLKATFANQDNVLWPGQFVDVSMVLTSRAARRQPGDDGLRGGDAAGEAIHDDRGHRLHDVGERARAYADHDPVQPRPEHRRRRSGRPGDDREVGAPPASRHADAADLPEGESGGPAGALPGLELADLTALHGRRVRPDEPRAADLHDHRRRAGAGVRLAEVRGPGAARSPRADDAGHRHRRGPAGPRPQQREPADRHPLRPAPDVQRDGDGSAAERRGLPAADRGLSQRLAGAARGARARDRRRADRQGRQLVQRRARGRPRAPAPARNHQRRCRRLGPHA